MQSLLQLFPPVLHFYSSEVSTPESPETNLCRSIPDPTAGCCSQPTEGLKARFSLP